MPELRHPHKIHITSSTDTPDEAPRTGDRRASRVTAIGDWLRGWRQAQQRREQLHNLLSFEDHLLEDLGYTRGDLKWGVRQPLRVNAAHAVLAHRRTQQGHARP